MWNGIHCFCNADFVLRYTGGNNPMYRIDRNDKRNKCLLLELIIFLFALLLDYEIPFNCKGNRRNQQAYYAIILLLISCFFY